MKKTVCMACFGLMAVFFLTGCGRSKSEYKKKLEVKTDAAPELVFDRYEDVLFHLDTADFQEELKVIQKDYQPFLNGDLDDLEAVKYLRDFAIDTFSIGLYHKVKEAFPDLKLVEEVVGTEYAHFAYYYPEIQLPTHVYTCVSGVNPSSPSVMFADNALVISLDWYLSGDEFYDWIGMPRYRSDRTCPESLARDLGLLIYTEYVLQWHKQTNLLEEMVQAGKQYYFIEAMFPDIEDPVLLGYSQPQMQWVKDFEGDLWADVVGAQILYSTEQELFRTFFSDGPFTNEYSHEAPPRLGEYLGLQIVRSYMNGHDISLQELMQNNDLQGIFLESGYKPKKN